MKIKLNLLPKIKEKKLRHKRILRFVVIQEIMIVFVTLLFFGAVIGLDAIAKLKLNEVDQQLSNSGNSKDYAEMIKYESKFKETKENVKLINNLQKNDINWLIVFDKLAQICPQDILFNSITGDGYDLTIGGNAKNRDVLINMKEIMEKDACFKNIDIPLSNVVLRENIEFELKFNVDEKCIKGL